MPCSMDTLLLAAAVDRLSLLVWAKTKNAQKGISLLLATILFVFFIPQLQFQDFSLGKGLPAMRKQFLEKNKRAEEALSVPMGYLEELNPVTIGFLGSEGSPSYPILCRFKGSGVQISEIDVTGSENPLKLRKQSAWEKYRQTMVSEPDVIVADGVSLPDEFMYENNLYVLYNKERIPPYIYARKSLLDAADGR